MKTFAITRTGSIAEVKPKAGLPKDALAHCTEGDKAWTSTPGNEHRINGPAPILYTTADELGIGDEVRAASAMERRAEKATEPRKQRRSHAA